MRRKVPCLLAFVLAARVAGAQTPAPGDVTNGRGLFQTRCADCHGIDAKGVHGPDLTVIFANGATDDRVFQTIRRGVAGTEMPASNAPDAELRAIVAYLHTLSPTPNDAPGPTGSGQGNAANGDRLFNQ